MGVIVLIIGTTPTFTLTVTDDEDLDFNEAENIYFTIRQGSIKYTKSGEDIQIVDAQTLQVSLTQEETLSFRYNLDAEIQLNWTYANGARAATIIKTITLSKNLIREVIE